MVNLNNAPVESIIRESYLNVWWWKHVQPEVKEKFDDLVTRIRVLGQYYRDAYIQMFKFEHARRMIEGVAFKREQPGAVFGPALSEESYNCGKLPTKVLLGLQDWSEPNEPDVFAAMRLIEQIDALDTLGVYSQNMPNVEIEESDLRTILTRSNRAEYGTDDAVHAVDLFGE